MLEEKREDTYHTPKLSIVSGREFVVFDGMEDWRECVEAFPLVVRGQSQMG